MISIKVKPKDNINRILSRFKASVMAEGTMKIVRKKDEIKLLRKIESEESDWRG
jgi:ribosomal protein S21